MSCSGQLKTTYDTYMGQQLPCPVQNILEHLVWNASERVIPYQHICVSVVILDSRLHFLLKLIPFTIQLGQENMKTAFSNWEKYHFYNVLQPERDEIFEGTTENIFLLYFQLSHSLQWCRHWFGHLHISLPGNVSINPWIYQFLILASTMHSVL